MAYRIGKEYIKMKCRLCHSVYLLDRSEITQTKVEQVEPDPDDPDDDGWRYNFEFYCEDCDRNMRNGVYLGKVICTDEYIENCVKEMKPLH